MFTLAILCNLHTLAHLIQYYKENNEIIFNFQITKMRLKVKYILKVIELISIDIITQAVMSNFGFLTNKINVGEWHLKMEWSESWFKKTLNREYCGELMKTCQIKNKNWWWRRWNLFWKDLDGGIKYKAMNEEGRQTENCFHDWLSLGVLGR